MEVEEKGGGRLKGGNMKSHRFKTSAGEETRFDVSGVITGQNQNDNHLSLSFYQLFIIQRERAAAQTAQQLNNGYN